MGLTQGNFERATISGARTLDRLLNDDLQLGNLGRRDLLTILHDLELIGAAVRNELMNREH